MPQVPGACGPCRKLTSSRPLRSAQSAGEQLETLLVVAGWTWLLALSARPVKGPHISFGPRFGRSLLVARCELLANFGRDLLQPRSLLSSPCPPHSHPPPLSPTSRSRRIIPLLSCGNRAQRGCGAAQGHTAGIWQSWSCSGGRWGPAFPGSGCLGVW